jgi:hypothetical protein
MSSEKDADARLLHQHLRNRTIDLIDLSCCAEDIARLGVFEVINLFDDIHPLDYHEAPGVFSAKEQEALGQLLLALDHVVETLEHDLHETDDVVSHAALRGFMALARSAKRVFEGVGA